MGESEFPFPDFFPEDWGDDSDEPADGADRPDGERAPDGDPPTPDEEFPGQLVLRGQNASEILRRLCNGDPLDFAGRTLHPVHGPNT